MICHQGFTVDKDKDFTYKKILKVYVFPELLMKGGGDWRKLVRGSSCLQQCTCSKLDYIKENTVRNLV
jgi:hypothetical protein